MSAPPKIEFPVPADGWGTVTHILVLSVKRSGRWVSRRMRVRKFREPVTVNSDDAAPRFTAGALKIIAA